MAEYNFNGNEVWIKEGDNIWLRGVVDYVLSANKTVVDVNDVDSAFITVIPANTGICEIIEVDTNLLLDIRKVNAGESFIFEYVPDTEGTHILRAGSVDIEFGFRLNEVTIVCRGYDE